MKLSGAASPQTNDVVSIEVQEFYTSDRWAKIKDTKIPGHRGRCQRKYSRSESTGLPIEGTIKKIILIKAHIYDFNQQIGHIGGYSGVQDVLEFWDGEGWV